MKKHTFYKWFRRMAMLSGIPALTMMFACTCKYGMPRDLVKGKIVDKETNSPVSGALIEYNHGGETFTDEQGTFELHTFDCADMTITRVGYQAKDTTLCSDEEHVIKLQRLPEE